MKISERMINKKTENKSLTTIAYEAGFKNIHDRASQCAGLMGSIMSDKFESIYFKHHKNKIMRNLNAFLIIKLEQFHELKNSVGTERRVEKHKYLVRASIEEYQYCNKKQETKCY